MGEKIKDNSSKEKEVTLPPEVTKELMCHLLDYYVKLNSIVRKKMGHAQAATRQELARLKNEPNSHKTSKRTDELEELDSLWQKIIYILTDPNTTVDTLELINASDKHLIQHAIGEIYQSLIEQDHKLISLIEEIEEPEYQRLYKKAKKITDTIQGRKDRLSQLPLSEFEFNSNEQLEEIEQKLIIERPKSDVDMVTLPNGKTVRIL